MRFFSLFLLLFVVSTLLIGGTMYKNDFSSGNFTNVQNLTSNITWENINPINISIGDTGYAKVFSGMINKGIDFFWYMAIETIKLGINFGYNNPQYDWNLLFSTIKLAIIATIVGGLAPLLLPLLAIVTIIIMGAISLIKFITKKYKGVKKYGK